jgi:hypothetical protein
MVYASEDGGSSFTMFGSLSPNRKPIFGNQFFDLKFADKFKDEAYPLMTAKVYQANRQTCFTSKTN